MNIGDVLVFAFDGGRYAIHRFALFRYALRASAQFLHWEVIHLSQGMARYAYSAYREVIPN